METYSLFIIKPGFANVFEQIKEILTQNDIKIQKQYFGNIDKEILAKHYAEHFGKPFYNKLIGYMSDGKIGEVQFDSKSIVMVVSSQLENETEQDFITRSRKLVKEVIRPSFELTRENLENYVQNPQVLNTIENEKLNEVFITANVIHASDSPESAKREIENMQHLFVV